MVRVCVVVTRESVNRGIGGTIERRSNTLHAKFENNLCRNGSSTMKGGIGRNRKPSSPIPSHRIDTLRRSAPQETFRHFCVW